MLTADTLETAKGLVKTWVDYWHREGRLDGGLDNFARKDLEERVATAITDARKPKKRLRREECGD